MRRPVWLPALIALVAVAGAASGATLRGRIVNGTGLTLGEPVEVHVVGFGANGGEWNTADARNGFLFENVPGGADNPLLLQATYRGVSYNDQFTVGPSADTTLVIEVYETTTDAAGVGVEELEIDLRRSGTDRLRIDQIYRVMNLSDPPRTLIGSGDGTFRISLPVPASQLPDLALAVSRGIVPVRREAIPTDRPTDVSIDYPLRPGFTAVAASYEVAYPETYDFRMTSFLAIPQTVLVVPIDMTVEGEGVQAAHGGAQGVGVYTVTALPAGGELAFRANGGSETPPEEPSMPASTPPRSGRVFVGGAPFEDVRVVVVVLLGVILLVGLVIAFRRASGDPR